MKYLKKYNESEYTGVSGNKTITNIIEDINYAIIDLKDEGWCTTVSYSPKRWENPPAVTYKSDFIIVTIKKVMTESGSRYPKGCVFNLQDVSQYVERIYKMFPGSNIVSRLCLPEIEDRNGYTFGRWGNTLSNLNRRVINAKDDVVGLEMRIYLDGENIYQNETMKYLKKYNLFEARPVGICTKSKLNEITNDIKDMLLDFEDDGFEIKVTSSSIDKWDDSITIQIMSPHTYIDSGTIGPGTWTSSKKTVFNADRVLKFTDRVSEYFKMDNIKYDIQYQWHGEDGVFKDTYNETDFPSGNITNIWVEIFIDKSTYKLFESNKSLSWKDGGGNIIYYYYEWAMPNSKIRRELTLDINNILLDVKDLGYGSHTGWLTEPYVWIGGRGHYNREEITPIVDRIINYLKLEGFNIDIEELKNQIKIIFH